MSVCDQVCVCVCVRGVCVCVSVWVVCVCLCAWCVSVMLAGTVRGRSPSVTEG